MNKKKWFEIKWIITKNIFLRWIFWKKTIDKLDYKKYEWRLKK